MTPSQDKAQDALVKRLNKYGLRAISKDFKPVPADVRFVNAAVKEYRNWVRRAKKLTLTDYATLAVAGLWIYAIIISV